MSNLSKTGLFRILMLIAQSYECKLVYVPLIESVFKMTYRSLWQKQRLRIIRDGQVNRAIWFMYYSSGVRSMVALVSTSNRFSLSSCLSVIFVFFAEGTKVSDCR